MKSVIIKSVIGFVSIFTGILLALQSHYYYMEERSSQIEKYGVYNSLLTLRNDLYVPTTIVTALMVLCFIIAVISITLLLWDLLG